MKYSIFKKLKNCNYENFWPRKILNCSIRYVLNLLNNIYYLLVDDVLICYRELAGYEMLKYLHCFKFKFNSSVIQPAHNRDKF